MSNAHDGKVWVSAEVHKRLEDEAARRGVTLKHLVELALAGPLGTEPSPTGVYPAARDHNKNRGHISVTRDFYDLLVAEAERRGTSMSALVEHVVNATAESAP